MRLLWRALLIGALTACLREGILLADWMLWPAPAFTDLWLPLSVGALFAVIFPFALAKFHRANAAISGMRAVVLAMHDLNLTAARNGKQKYDPHAVSDALLSLARTAKEYAELQTSFLVLQRCIDNLHRATDALYAHLPSEGKAALLRLQETLREHTSCLSHAKASQFPTIGMHTLQLGIGIGILVRLFCVSGDVLADILQIFGIATLLTFLVLLLRDLDRPFRRMHAVFVLDTLVLTNTIKSLRQSIAAFEEEKTSN